MRTELSDTAILNKLGTRRKAYRISSGLAQVSEVKKRAQTAMSALGSMVHTYLELDLRTKKNNEK